MFVGSARIAPAYGLLAHDLPTGFGAPDGLHASVAAAAGAVAEIAAGVFDVEILVIGLGGGKGAGGFNSGCDFLLEAAAAIECSFAGFGDFLLCV